MPNQLPATLVNKLLDLITVIGTDIKVLTNNQSNLTAAQTEAISRIDNTLSAINQAITSNNEAIGGLVDQVSTINSTLANHATLIEQISNSLSSIDTALSALIGNS